MWPRGAEGFFTRHGVKDCLAGILLSPDACESAGAELANLLHLVLGLPFHTQQAVPGIVLKGEFTSVVIFLIGGRGVVRVRVADKTITEWVSAHFFLQAKAVQQCLPGIASGLMIGHQRISRQGIVPQFKAGKFVVG